MLQNILLHADSILILLLDNKSVKILHKNNIHLYERKFIIVGWILNFMNMYLKLNKANFTVNLTLCFKSSDNRRNVMIFYIHIFVVMYVSVIYSHKRAGWQAVLVAYIYVNHNYVVNFTNKTKKCISCIMSFCNL